MWSNDRFSIIKTTMWSTLETRFCSPRRPGQSSLRARVDLTQSDQAATEPIRPGRATGRRFCGLSRGASSAAPETQAGVRDELHRIRRGQGRFRTRRQRSPWGGCRQRVAARRDLAEVRQQLDGLDSAELEMFTTEPRRGVDAVPPERPSERDSRSSALSDGTVSFVRILSDHQLTAVARGGVCLIVGCERGAGDGS